MSQEIQNLKQRLNAVEEQFTDVAQAYQTLQDSFLEMQAVYEYAYALSTISELDELFDFTEKNLRTTFKASVYAVHFYSQEDNTFELRSSYDWLDKPYESGLRPVLQEAVASNEPVISEFGKEAVLALPLSNKTAEIIAILTVLRGNESPFQPSEVRLLSRIAAFLAGVIEKILLYESTRVLSLRDELTGLHNRRAFNQTYELEMERGQRYGRSLAVLMLDIDYFKHYNDMHGHLQGDVALQKVAAALTRVLRKADLLARYGGEEFVILLPETTKEQAKLAANKLRRVIEKERFELEEHQPGGCLTISVGLAAFPADSENMEELLELADRALYTAKDAGRNTIAWPGMKAGTARKAPSKTTPAG